jgi:L-fucose isomerase-like protein
MKYQILGLSSDLMGRSEIQRVGREYINDLQTRSGIEMEWVVSPEDFDLDGIPLIFVQTGGTEGLFVEQFDHIPQPIFLLTHGAMNSLAASLEILTYLKKRSVKGEVLHGELDYVANRLIHTSKIRNTRHYLAKAKLGVIGKPSDWLIASDVDKEKARAKLGCEIIDIPIDELIQLSLENYDIEDPLVLQLKQKPFPSRELQKALNIYGALCKIIEKYQLDGLTLRCFDLLEPLNSTGCIGLALLNAKGIPSSCEGDVPALISMMILQSLLGEPGFMVNPSRINVRENSMVVAHCTLPINMGESFQLDTHYESGIGVGVKGSLPLQKAMMFKLAPDLDRYFVSEIEILENLSEKNLCRTQIKIRLAEDVNYFLSNPCGNHHIITLNKNIDLLKKFMESIS